MALQKLVSAFAVGGVAVCQNYPRGQEPNLEGLYVRGRRELVVCRRDDQSLTLRHEVWHLVQSLCLRDRPWLEPECCGSGCSRPCKCTSWPGLN